MQLINALLTADSPFQLRPRGGGAEGGGQRGGAEGALQGRGGGSFGGSRQERPTDVEKFVNQFAKRLCIDDDV